MVYSFIVTGDITLTAKYDNEPIASAPTVSINMGERTVDPNTGKNAVVIDVGINVDESGNLCGDVDFDNVAQKTSVITPVPGGVGSVTTSVLAKHLLRAAKMRKS